MPADAPTSSMNPIAPAAFGAAQARRLLWRAGFGATPAQIDAFAALGPTRAVEHLLNVQRIPFTPDDRHEFDDSIMLVDDTNREDYRRAQRAGDEDTLARLRLRRQEQQRRDREQMRAMQRWWLARMIETPRPLEEKMTLFWHGLFASSYRKTENSWHMHAQNRLFRAHALGNFGALLGAIVRDPAMLAFLDNNRSRKERPNENLARELMELFSLGEGNYSERDIQEGARALTGHSFDGNEFVFRSAWHDEGAKTILGQSGPLDGAGFVRAILARPECPKFLAWRLYRFFVDNETPSDEREQAPGAAAAIRRLASTLRREKYEVAPALRELFLSERFHDEASGGGVIKSPAELVVGAIRSLGAPTRDLGALVDAMERMGQGLFFPPSVAGWSGGRSWITTSTLYVRQNTLVYLATGDSPRRRERDRDAKPDDYDPTALLAPLAGAATDLSRDPAAVADLLVRLMLPAPTGTQREALSAFLREKTVTRASVRDAICLLGAAPEHQLT